MHVIFIQNLLCQNRKIHNLSFTFFRVLEEKDREISQAFFDKHISQSICQLFGEVASAQPIDVLKFNPKTTRAIIRVLNDNYVKVRASLSLAGAYEENSCTYCVHKASRHLIALTANSKESSNY